MGFAYQQALAGAMERAHELQRRLKLCSVQSCLLQSLPLCVSQLRLICSWLLTTPWPLGEKRSRKCLPWLQGEQWARS